MERVFLASGTTQLTHLFKLPTFLPEGSLKLRSNSSEPQVGVHPHWQANCKQQEQHLWSAAEKGNAGNGHVPIKITMVSSILLKRFI
jgi:hypothetical protein